MSLQRTRGQVIQYWKSVVKTNLRGDEVTVPLDGPYTAKAWVTSGRSAKAEVPGQLEIGVIRMGVDTTLDPADPDPRIDLWSRVRFRGDDYDLVAPPAERYGSRHTHHYTIDLRKRVVTRG